MSRVRAHPDGEWSKGAAGCASPTERRGRVRGYACRDARGKGRPAVNGPLAEMFRYNRWANLRLIDACQALTDDQLASNAPGASGSIGELLTHLVGGQQTFVLRTKGRQHQGELGRRSEWPGIAIIRAVATAT